MFSSLDSRRLRLLPWLVAVAFFMQTLDGTILNIALPSMARDLAENPLHMQSVVIAYLLTVAFLIPISGWLADRFGCRRVFQMAIVLFTFGSLCCALSTTLEQLVVARIVQGVGGALMVPIGRLTILRVYPRHEFIRVMVLVTVPGMIGPLIGPSVGGWLVEYASWHWIFLINLPVGVLGCIATRFVMPKLAMVRTRFDSLGFLAFGGSMVLLSLALEGLGELHWPIWHIVLLLLSGLVCMTAYWVHAGRVAYPLFSTQLFQTRNFTVGIWGNLFARLGIGALPFLLPLLLQVALEYSPAQAGMSLVAQALGAIGIKPLANALILRWGYRRILSLNTLLIGVLIASLAAIDRHTPLPLLLLHLAALGVVNSLQFTAMNTVTLIGLRDDQASSGNSLLSVVVQLAMSMGIALAGALLSGFTRADAGGIDVLDTFKLTFLCIGGLTILAAGMFLLLDRGTGLGDEATAKPEV